MEMSEGLSQQERLQVIAEKRKRQADMENKKRQLEDDKRQLSHLKQKSLRERWLLEGAAGAEQDEAKKQLAEDEAKLRTMEENINRLELELEELESGVSATSTRESLTEAVQEEHAQTAGIKAQRGAVQEVKEVLKVHNSPRLDISRGASDMRAEVKSKLKVHNSPRLEISGGASDMMRAAMYSVEITVERDNITGETKVLSTNTLLPVDLSGQGVKVYEDYQKVVHEVNGEDGFHPLSAHEVDELIHKADESMMSDITPAGATSTAPVVHSDADLATERRVTPQKEITGMEAKVGGASPQEGGGQLEASAENPVTMVFMGYQSVEDEAETKKVLGLEGTVKAELVVIEDGDGKNVAVGPSPANVTVTEGGAKDALSAPPNGSAADPTNTPKETAPVGEKVGEPDGGATEPNNKEKQPCKCCTIM